MINNLETRQNEIVIYQPDDTMRLEVKLAEDSVWLSQEQMIELFQRDRSVISRHIRNAFQEGEVDETNCLHFLQTNQKGRPEAIYNLDVVISVGYRVKSIRGTQFRRWATRVLREYALQGFVINNRLAAEVNRRLADHEKRIEDVEQRIDFVVRSALPAPEQVFVNGQFLDAHVELLKIIRSAKKRIVLVDNFIDERVFTLLAQRKDNVDCTIYSRGANKHDVRLAADRYAQQYPAQPIALVQTGKSHDRFLIVDNTTWHVGASPKDAGARIFALMKMKLDPKVILALLP